MRCRYKVTFSSTHSFSRCQRTSRCLGRVVPQVTTHGVSGDVWATDMCSSHWQAQPWVQCAGSGYGVPCWSHLEAQRLEASEGKNCSYQQNRWDDWACLLPTSVGDRQWTPNRIPHKRWKTPGGGLVSLWHGSSRSAPPLCHPSDLQFPYQHPCLSFSPRTFILD